MYYSEIATLCVLLVVNTYLLTSDILMKKRMKELIVGIIVEFSIIVMIVLIKLFT